MKEPWTLFVLCVALVIVSTCMPVVVSAGPPAPSAVERLVQGAWETLKVFCAEWGCWGQYLAQGYELETALAYGQGVRTPFASELAKYPWVRYVATLTRPWNGMMLVVPSAPVRAWTSAPSTLCTECARLRTERARAPWWTRWWYDNQLEVRQCHACG